MIIDWAGLSIHAFSIRIGMTRSENLYRILKNKDNVSIKIWVQILETYPQINRNWSIYGEGEMLNVEEIEIVGEKIPYYEVIGNKSLYNFCIPLFSDADMALSHSDKAMEPLIPSCATVILKKHSLDFIVYGQIYYIETKEISLIRTVRKSNVSDDEIILETPENTRYGRITMTKDKILNIYTVQGFLYKF